MDTSKKELIKFLRFQHRKRFFFFWTIAVLIMFSVFLAECSLFSLFMLVVAVLLGCIPLHPQLLLWFSIKELTERGELEHALGEFSRASTILLDGKVRLATNYLFGQGSGRVFSYREIMQVYQEVHRTYFIETYRELIVVVGGHDYTLCRLPRRGKGADDMTRIVKTMQLRNPAIEFVYR